MGRAPCGRRVPNVANPAVMTVNSDRNPRHHTQKMKKALKEIQDHLRDDITKVDEPQFKAMFEISAEVLAVS